MTSGKESRLCAACFQHIEWLEESLACKICGHPKRLKRSVRCPACRKKPIYLQPYAACFAGGGVASDLASQVEDSAKLLASLMVLKLKKLPWPLPDTIVPMPHSRLEVFSRKHQPSYLLAKELSRLLERPLKMALRTHEKGTSFDYTARGDLSDQKVLLVANCIEDSGRMKECRFALETLYPKTIYTLVLIDAR